MPPRRPPPRARVSSAARPLRTAAAAKELARLLEREIRRRHDQIRAREIARVERFTLLAHRARKLVESRPEIRLVTPFERRDRSVVDVVQPRRDALADAELALAHQ